MDQGEWNRRYGGSELLWTGRISVRSVDDRFAEYRDELGLPRELVAHCLRHSYITHLHEDGFDPLFINAQATAPRVPFQKRQK